MQTKSELTDYDPDEHRRKSYFGDGIPVAPEQESVHSLHGLLNVFALTPLDSSGRPNGRGIAKMRCANPLWRRAITIAKFPSASIHLPGFDDTSVTVRMKFDTILRCNFLHFAFFSTG